MKKPAAISLILIFLLAGMIFIYSYVCFQNPLYFFKEQVNIENLAFPYDRDGDGLSDLDDMVEGARKEIENHTKYRSAYYEGGYPPENEGVCTDVIWRALKNTGYDLKELMDADIDKNVKQYTWIDEMPDPNIDFRRVRNQRVFFNKFADNLTTEVIPYDMENLRQWQRGDLVVLEKSDHIAVISDKRRRDGVPYILHNASTYPKEENKLMNWHKSNRIIAHFRFPKTQYK